MRASHNSFGDVCSGAALMRRRELRTEDASTVEVVTTLVRPGTAEFFLELPVPAV